MNGVLLLSYPYYIIYIPGQQINPKRYIWRRQKPSHHYLHKKQTLAGPGVAGRRKRLWDRPEDRRGGSAAGVPAAIFEVLFDAFLPVGADGGGGAAHFTDGIRKDIVVEPRALGIAVEIGGAVGGDSEAAGGPDGVDVGAEEEELPAVRWRPCRRGRLPEGTCAVSGAKRSSIIAREAAAALNLPEGTFRNENSGTRSAQT